MRTECGGAIHGFRGLDLTAPLYRYFRHLPHWRQDGATYFVTFRLSDALPADVVAVLKRERDEWLAKHPGFFEGRAIDPSHEALRLEYERLAFASLDRWLDTGQGACKLAQADARAIVADVLGHWEGVRYRMGCYVVMPNHVHAVVCPSAVGRVSDPSHGNAVGRVSDPSHGTCWPLEDIVGGWKQWSGKKLGIAWQGETYDRIVRDALELHRTVAYVRRNQEKARGVGTFWMRPDWVSVFES
jgi:hypothetical protein